MFVWLSYFTTDFGWKGPFVHGLKRSRFDYLRNCLILVRGIWLVCCKITQCDEKQTLYNGNKNVVRFPYARISSSGGYFYSPPRAPLLKTQRARARARAVTSTDNTRRARGRSWVILYLKSQVNGHEILRTTRPRTGLGLYLTWWIITMRSKKPNMRRMAEWLRHLYKF